MESINISSVLDRFKLTVSSTKENTTIDSYSPVDDNFIGSVPVTIEEEYNAVIENSAAAFNEWKQLPSPKRGEIVRQIGDALRIHKKDLATLVSYEMGKSLQEGYGEVQEMIDICDFAVGLSRQLYGLTTQSERPQHRMYEQWLPLGIVGIISAFNFPVAVWSWNAAIAWVCGNVCVWKPSEKTPITALACQKLASEIFVKNGINPAVSSLVQGDAALGKLMAADVRIPLISATGSTKMGKSVAQTVAARLGKTILELGGNNAIIITENADIETALLASVFGAVGTAGQRCTTTRRLIIHENIYESFKQRLVNAYEQIRVGNPLDERNHVGPLIDKDAVAMYLDTIDKCKTQGGKFIVEGGILEGQPFLSPYYVKPCIAEVDSSFKVVQTETFAPILYIMKYRTLQEAIAIQNDVPQGLSSSIMTLNLREAELFLSINGSDCGIANVNIGTSGAEIGGAFGGEKETGGGRESGSDAWKAYMRRQTNTINYSEKLPLAQGIKFDLS
ncbi:aldehyde dehydrogenase family protein [Olivibacter sp. SDN3]|uniref:L-piperidine-6-carboxylate dehydrogenase n=1 Tax=Olivibacter sp. SDN3 TaxID=2764720 RepID=UPI001651051C|nr:aldehyde dehydrogenase family protein [Olivibacter sp. SDN3]QNL51149.1 aldehyde dehydrogenase family protein [Olivibacter sp. SDN3]